MRGMVGSPIVKAVQGRDPVPLSVRSPVAVRARSERMPMHPNECRFAAKILKICVHTRARAAAVPIATQ